MTTLINVKALIYLWTRDAEMPVSKETRDYVIDHLVTTKKNNLEFSDMSRLEMVERILELV